MNHWLNAGHAGDESSRGTYEITSHFEVARRPRKAPRHSRLYRRLYRERHGAARLTDACFGTRDFSDSPAGGSNDQPVKPGPLPGIDRVTFDRSAMRCQPDPGRRETQSSFGVFKAMLLFLGRRCFSVRDEPLSATFACRKFHIAKREGASFGDYVSFGYVSRTAKDRPGFLSSRQLSWVWPDWVRDARASLTRAVSSTSNSQGSGRSRTRRFQGCTAPSGLLRHPSGSRRR